MGFSRIQIAIAVGAGVLVLLIFFGYLMWLNGQGPVLSRSEDRDPLSGTPNSISLNPLRDRTTEHVAAKYLDAMRDGHCQEELAQWEKDYRKKYAAFICASEAQHPLVSWKVVDWEDNPPLRILQYRGKRLNAPGQSGNLQRAVLRHARRQKRGVGSDEVRRDVLTRCDADGFGKGALEPSNYQYHQKQKAALAPGAPARAASPQSKAALIRRGFQVKNKEISEPAPSAPQNCPT